jgi:ATP-dependent DNA helicase RecG
MESTELLEIINRGEDSKNQFKANFTNVDSLAAEIVAFSNSQGGRLIIGVSDDGNVTGLSKADITRLNNLISNAATQSVRPPINPFTENVALPGGLVMVLTIPQGISRPYMDNNGAIWVKSGADKRKVTSREEMQRIFQASGLIHADEVPAKNMTIADLDRDYFKKFFQEQYGEPLDDNPVPLPQLLENMGIMKDGIFNIAGALFFAQNLEFRLPIFCTKCVVYPGNDIHVSKYLDSEDIHGKFIEVYQRSLSFISRNLRRIQGDKSINSTGELEIPKITLEEVIVNALVHRDYFVPAPIRIFIYDNRIEIISPGHLPNNLTVENIKNGISMSRNFIIASYAAKIFPYRGLGNGIKRALKEYPKIDFIDDRELNQFQVIIHRTTT